MNHKQIERRAALKRETGERKIEEAEATEVAEKRDTVPETQKKDGTHVNALLPTTSRLRRL